MSFLCGKNVFRVSVIKFIITYFWKLKLVHRCVLWLFEVKSHKKRKWSKRIFFFVQFVSMVSLQNRICQRAIPYELTSSSSFDNSIIFFFFIEFERAEKNMFALHHFNDCLHSICRILKYHSKKVKFIVYHLMFR